MLLYCFSCIIIISYPGRCANISRQKLSFIWQLLYMHTEVPVYMYVLSTVMLKSIHVSLCLCVHYTCMDVIYKILKYDSD